MNRQVFLLGYMQKQALWPELWESVKGALIGATGVGKSVWETAWPLLIAAPPALGVAAGMAHSKLTSPVEQDQENIQRAMHSAEMDEMLMALRRRRKLMEQKEKQKKKMEMISERSIHI